ncbi:unnamed protein product [Cuscuta epithymum]|uniref:Uncharacterized protein n=1 Tax=Cuscuta epithymum TaxID=186058 RepID=A0AAV0DDW8_9ASTE|nr:unnamed protein product [Cuscuta epithymum]
MAWNSIGWSWSASPAQSFLEQIRAEFEARKEEDLCRLVWGCWGLWCERNNRTWNGVISDPNQILVKTRMYISIRHAAEHQYPRSPKQQAWSICLKRFASKTFPIPG